MEERNLKLRKTKTSRKVISEEVSPGPAQNGAGCWGLCSQQETLCPDEAVGDSGSVRHPEKAGGNNEPRC